MNNLTGTAYTRTRERGHAPWKPQAKNAAILTDVQGVLAELVPTFGAQGNRGIAYRLTERGYEKDDKHFDDIDNVSNRGRRGGHINWTEIYDPGFRTVGDDGLEGIDDFHNAITRQAANYRRDRQEGQPVRKLLWVEAAGTLGMIHHFARPFGIPVVTGGGSDSTSGKREVALDIAKRTGTTRIGVIADHDQHGLAIADARTSDISTFVHEFNTRFTYTDLNGNEAEPTGTVEWKWLTVRPDQIDTYNLTSKPSKPGKQRVGDNTDARLRTVQVEALHPTLLRRIVRDFIGDDWDPDAYIASRRLEREERGRIVSAVTGLRFGGAS